MLFVKGNIPYTPALPLFGYRTVNLASFPGLISKRTGLETRLTVRFRKAAQRLCRQEVISEKHSFTSSSPPVHTKVTMTVPGVQVQGLATERWLELRSRINDVLSQLDKMSLLCLA